MAEPESLATDEALDAHIARHAYDRLIMLSDGIFAIATTLTALEMRLPATASDPLSLWAAMWRPLFAYALSFAVIAVFWLSSRDLFARLARVTRPVTGLTLIILWLVALIPLGVSGVAGHSISYWSWFRTYAAMMMMAGLANAALWTYASFAPGVMRAEVPAHYRWTRSLGSLSMPVLFLPLVVISSVDGFDYAVGLIVVVAFLRRLVLPRYLRRKFPVESLS